MPSLHFARNLVAEWWGLACFRCLRRILEGLEAPKRCGAVCGRALSWRTALKQGL